MYDTLSWSDFRIRIELPTGDVLIKSTLTSAIVTLHRYAEAAITRWVEGNGEKPSFNVDNLAHENIGLLVRREDDEYTAWRNHLIDRRNNAARTFILHFLPTIQCQLECKYCFENGGDRQQGMKPDIMAESRKWLDTYLGNYPEIDTFRLVLFGGEPLLRKDIVAQGVKAFHSLARERKLDFWCELTSNGELLDEPIAAMLSQHEWRRVQITLDGLKDVHNTRRHGKNMRPTFDRIVENIRMLLSTDYIPAVDVRISFDLTNADNVSELIRYLATFGRQDRINLSLGLITSTLGNPNRMGEERLIAQKALLAWQVAKGCGFKVPDEFITGPWCVAIAKHSAVLQPDGALQKCFCTAGREEYNFGTIREQQTKGYLRDSRFEHFRRTDQCVKEKCQYLPMCGGGCIHDAIVAGGGPDGAAQRFCQKTLLKEMNDGLLRLAYGG